MEAEQIYKLEIRKLFLEEAIGIISQFESDLMRINEESDFLARLKSMSRAVNFIKGSGATAGFSDLAEFANTIEKLIQVLRSRKVMPTAKMISELLVSAEVIHRWLNELGTADGAIPTPADAQLSTTNINALFDIAKSVPSITEKQSSENPAILNTKTTTHRSTTTRPTLKIDIDKVDTVMDLCGELVVIKSQLAEQPEVSAAKHNPELAGVLGLLDKTIREMYDKIMSMRMLSLKPTFQTLERAVHDVSGKLGKHLIFESEGEDTELDRVMIEQLADPLMHICRNAVDHGIEIRQKRIEMGKAPIATIRISAFNEGSRVVIEVEDDGAGISRDIVLKKAREKNLISDHVQDHELTDLEVHNLLFAPGFSTVDQVSDISGRGVGLDVVRANITALKGEISIISTPGKGTTFRLRLPMTTAIADGILVDVGGRQYILPTTIVSEFVPLRDGSIIRMKDGGECLNLRGVYVPVIRLGQALGIPTEQCKDGLVIITGSGSKQNGVVVDAVHGQSQVVLKSVHNAIHASDLVAGAAIMGDGKVVLVIDTSNAMVA